MINNVYLMRSRNNLLILIYVKLYVIRILYLIVQIYLPHRTKKDRKYNESMFKISSYEKKTASYEIIKNFNYNNCDIDTRNNIIRVKFYFIISFIINFRHQDVLSCIDEKSNKFEDYNYLEFVRFRNKISQIRFRRIVLCSTISILYRVIISSVYNIFLFFSINFITLEEK